MHLYFSESDMNRFSVVVVVVFLSVKKHAEMLSVVRGNRISATDVEDSDSVGKKKKLYSFKLALCNSTCFLSFVFTMSLIAN